MKAELNNTDTNLYFEAINRLSSKKQTQIANICYANVAGLFATFCNKSNRGPNFKWASFTNHCIKWSDTWMMTNAVSGNKKLVNALAAYQAKEIAETLLDHSGFIESSAE